MHGPHVSIVAGDLGPALTIQIMQILQHHVLSTAVGLSNGLHGAQIRTIQP